MSTTAVFESAEAVDGRVCVRYTTRGGRGRIVAEPAILRLRETAAGFTLDVFEAYWDRSTQQFQRGRAVSILRGLSLDIAEKLAALGVAVKRRLPKAEVIAAGFELARTPGPRELLRGEPHQVIAPEVK